MYIYIYLCMKILYCKNGCLIQSTTMKEDWGLMENFVLNTNRLLLAGSCPYFLKKGKQCLHVQLIQTFKWDSHPVFFNMPICVLLEFMSNTKAGCLNRSGLTSDHIKRQDILENVEMNMILDKLSILIVQNKPNNVRPMIIAITYV